MERDALQLAVGEWSDRTFPASDPEIILRHLKEEVQEVCAELDFKLDKARNVDNLEGELADCHLLLLHYAHRRGFSLFNITNECLQQNRIYFVNRRMELAMEKLEESFRQLDETKDPLFAGEVVICLEVLSCLTRPLNVISEEKFALIQKRTWLPPDENGIVRHVKG